METLRARLAALDALPAADTLSRPWKRPIRLAVGGLWNVGFADDTDLLMIAGNVGRSLIDCRLGAEIARDDGEFSIDRGNLLIVGIGQIDGARVRVGGIHGGGLATTTPDNWRLERHPTAWPDEALIVSPPGHSLLRTPQGEPLKSARLAEFDAALCSFGFSPTGLTLIVATAASVTIYRRDDTVPGRPEKAQDGL